MLLLMLQKVSDHPLLLCCCVTPANAAVLFMLLCCCGTPANVPSHAAVLFMLLKAQQAPLEEDSCLIQM
jgi:hypothetical protein